MIRYTDEAYAIYAVNQSDQEQQIKVSELSSPRAYQGDYAILDNIFEDEIIAPKGSLFVYDA